MAAMLAVNHRYLLEAGVDPKVIVGLIGLSGPYDLHPNNPTLRAIFAAPYTPKDWEVTGQVSPGVPPALLIHGSADDFVWPAYTEDLARAMSAAGSPVTLRMYPGRKHAATVAALTPVLPNRAPTLADINAFMRSLP